MNVEYNTVSLCLLKEALKGGRAVLGRLFIELYSTERYAFLGT